jgi:cell division septation protein DedD
MLTERRFLDSRHEFRFGTRELILGAVALVVVWALTFVLGVLVGRELASGPAGARGSAGGPAAGTASATGAGAPKKPERSEERLTFYQTLTAPTPELPPAPAPRVEERLVPREPAAAGGAAAAAESRPPARPRARPRRDPAPSAPGAPAAPVVAPGSGPWPPAAPMSAAADGRLWTVQVSSFRSRALADELLARLSAKGFDAYLVSVTTDEGRVRHRVRVGGYASRVEAERVAGQLRSERNLSPFVTTRSR